MFKAHAGDNIIDQINFAADHGFTAWEENGLPDRPIEEQIKIGETLAARNMKMGVFVAYGSFDEPIFVRNDHPKRDEVLAKLKSAVEIAKRVNAKFMTVVPVRWTNSTWLTRNGTSMAGHVCARGSKWQTALNCLSVVPLFSNHTFSYGSRAVELGNQSWWHLPSICRPRICPLQSGQ